MAQTIDDLKFLMTLAVVVLCGTGLGAFLQ